MKQQGAVSLLLWFSAALSPQRPSDSSSDDNNTAAYESHLDGAAWFNNCVCVRVCVCPRARECKTHNNTEAGSHSPPIKAHLHSEEYLRQFKIRKYPLNSMNKYHRAAALELWWMETNLLFPPETIEKHLKWLNTLCLCLQSVETLVSERWHPEKHLVWAAGMTLSIKISPWRAWCTSCLCCAKCC